MFEPETLKATSLSIQYGLIFCILMQKNHCFSTQEEGLV